MMQLTSRAALIPVFVGIAALLSAHMAFAATPQPSLAMIGAAKYPLNFQHFDYVNPDAPKGGTLKLGVTGTFDSLNPFIVRGNPALGLSTGYLGLVYEPLMARSADEPFSLYGLLAESVEMPDNRASIVFNLNPKAQWSDGKPVTADDVLFSFESLRDKGRPNHRTYYKKVAKAEILAPRRIVFTFRANDKGIYDREMPLIMALMPVLPKHDWQGRDFSVTSLRVPVGSGPYMIEKVDIARSITYALNPNYWGRDLPVERGLHNFAKIQIDYYRDEGISLQAFKAGQYDWRRESDPNRWATAYDFPAAQDGRVKLEELRHSRVEPVTGFVFNTRRDVFKDKVLRQALSYAFDSGWINRNLFHGLYRRTTSFFPNSELAAPALPQGREKEILESFRAQLSPDIFTQPVVPPVTDGSEESARANLVKAEALLREAGYVMRDDRLLTPQKKAITFDILLSDPAQEKIALGWTRSLMRLGVAVRVHTVDSAQYQARLAAFDYDVIVGRWVNSLSPGNEQAVYWGSAASAQKGSRNYAGISDPVVDALIARIPESASREELVATVHALDRVLLAGNYIVPFYDSGVDYVASWHGVKRPQQPSPYGVVLESWWKDAAQ